jgi:hypothetical protein
MSAPDAEESETGVIPEPALRAWRSASRWAHILFWSSVAFAGFALVMLLATLIA